MFTTPKPFRSACAIRRAWAISAGLLLSASPALLGCDKGEKPESGAPAPSVQEPAAAPELPAAPSAVPADQPGTEAGLRPHLNLLNLAHMADVDQGGLFIDFGTPARMKYVSGGFKTGWGKDGKDGDTTYTVVNSTTGRIYLPIEGGGPQLLRVRAKAIGSQNMQLFLNNESLPLVKLSGDGRFGTYDVEVPESVIKPGENQLMLRLGGTEVVGGEEVSIALDYVRVMPKAAAGEGLGDKAGEKEEVLPRYGSLVGEVELGGVKRHALLSAAPGKFSWYLDIPAKASLSFRVGATEATGAEAAIRLTPEGGEPVALFAEPLQNGWKDGKVSLDKWAGQIVRLDLVASGKGQVAWGSPSLLVPEVKVAKAKPVERVVVLLIDTLRAEKLRIYNEKSRVQTPALDAFAKEGTVFVRAQSPENWTKPSVASVLTGLYPATHGTKKSESKLPDKALMVSEVFKKEGFSTATFLANGYVSDKFGFNQGWDHYTNYIREQKSTEAENVFKEAGDWIAKHKDERFFVYVQTIDPHVPYDPPDEYLAKYDAGEYTGQVAPRKTPDLLEQAKRNPPKVTFTARDRQRLEALHDGEISYHDDHFASFIERLKGLGLYDETLFIVTADHGEEFYEHGSYGHGHSVYQEMIHVPFVARLPGRIPAGKRIEETVGTLDISPTILSAAGIAVPEVMEGVDRMAHLAGRVPPRPAVAFSDFLDDRRVILAGRWKLILRGINATFFDLEKDPGEQSELKLHRHPIALRYCRTMLGQFLGAEDFGDWLAAEQQRGGAPLVGEDTEIDEKTREGLKALGYAN